MSYARSVRVLIFGGGGVLARSLASSFDLLYKERVRLVTRQECDVTDAGSVMRTLAEHLPSLVINCAAYTNVSRAEANVSEASSVNAVGATNVAIGARSIGADLIHISTDYVFSGHDRHLYRETDRPYPVQAYGLTKYWGERGVQATARNYLIVRLGWLFGKEYPNCAPMLAEHEGYEIEVKGEKSIHYANLWDDIVGTPTHVMLAADRIASSFPPYAQLDGGHIAHVAPRAEKAVSWYEFLVPSYKYVRRVKAPKVPARPRMGGLAPTEEMACGDYRDQLAMFEWEIRGGRSSTDTDPRWKLRTVRY